MRQKNAGLHAYSHFTHVMVSSYECNYAMDVDVQVSFDLNKITPRMRSLLICQYKRGYTLQPSRGALFKFTSMINNELETRGFTIDPLNRNTYIGSDYMAISSTNNEFITWLEVTSLLMNISDLTTIQKKGDHTTFHAYPQRSENPLDALNLKKFSQLIYQYIKEHKSELDFILSGEAAEAAVKIVTNGETIKHEYTRS